MSTATRLYIITILINTFFCSPTVCQIEPNTNLTGTKYDLPSVLCQDHPDWLANQLKNEASIKSSLHQLPSNPYDWKIYRDTLKAEIIKSTGALLGQELPLNMKETGSIRKIGYTIKNIIFQTRPENRISEFQTEFKQLRKRCMEPGHTTFIP